MNAQGRGKRLRFVDAAKGLAMLLVLIGHTVPGNETVRGFIYSFHVPLFFFLSGYTSRPPRDLRAFMRRHVRSFFQLIVPCVLLQMGLMVYLCILEGNLSAGRLIGLEKRAILQLFWAAAEAAEGRPAIGIPWFMFTLFWSRLLFDGIRMRFQKRAALPCLITAGAGFALGSVTFLPQSLDLAMASVLFLFAGEQARRLDALSPGMRRGISAASALVWALGVALGLRTDMAVHRYDLYGLSIAVSLCACVVVLGAMKRLEAAGHVSGALAFVGRISLYVFFVHHVDDYFMNLWYRENWWLCIANRIVVVVLIAAAVRVAVQGFFRLARRAARADFA